MRVLMIWIILFISAYGSFAQGLCKEIKSLETQALLYSVEDDEGRYLMLNLMPMSLFNDNFRAQFAFKLSPNDDDMLLREHLFYRITSYNCIEFYDGISMLFHIKFMKESDSIIFYLDDKISIIPKGKNNITNDFFKSLETGILY